MRAVTDLPATGETGRPRVGVVMGSRSDFGTMEGALELLARLGVPYEVRVLSAHRTPGLLASYAARAERLNLSCIIAGAGGAAHLPGMLAAFTRVPVLGVPVQSRAMSGQDSLLSIVQMPAGVPVATFAIGEAGAKNAALFAAGLLATTDPEVRARLDAFRAAQTQAVLDDPFFEGHPQAGAQ
ncbi:5-(carboxyamino)imidazole ribonucleotide mutase [Deinococcus sp. NW-56]|uniref:5-(carboxyamino)imidazole ribonucleotide mutase n=1 Tax=Deinococcus sp. NW-56 TaxID=2080419 RepID=UPI0018F869BF|nr:5-(carboxyamino)imidazole ribonucleotide mutase [Deinococcus sp. NW-56]